MNRSRSSTNGEEDEAGTETKSNFGVLPGLALAAAAAVGIAGAVFGSSSSSEPRKPMKALGENGKTMFRKDFEDDPKMSIATVDHALPHDTHNLYDVTFYSHNIHTLLTSYPSMVYNWLSETRSPVVGLDVEWHPNSLLNKENPVATLQLCVGPRCLIFQILHTPNVPQSLISFLRNANHTFVGVGIKEDMEKLVRDYSLRVAKFVDLWDLAVEKLGDKELKRSGIKTLARCVVGKEIEKPDSISRSGWDNLRLTPEQVKYACIDAFISFEVGRLLHSGQL